MIDSVALFYRCDLGTGNMADGCCSIIFQSNEFIDYDTNIFTSGCRREFAATHQRNTHHDVSYSIGVEVALPKLSISGLPWWWMSK